jgi:uncharacterized protein (TIGR03067 family)
MNKAAILGLVFPAVALWAAAPIPAGGAKKARPDKEAIQGTWIWVSAEAGGKKKPDGEFKAKQVATVIRGDTMTVRHKGRETQSAKYRLDPTKSPKEIDLTIEQGDRTFVLKGIYLLEGDSLTICQGGPDDARPKKFASEAGPAFGVLRLKREK